MAGEGGLEEGRKGKREREGKGEAERELSFSVSERRKYYFLKHNLN